MKYFVLLLISLACPAWADDIAARLDRLDNWTAVTTIFITIWFITIERRLEKTKDKLNKGEHR